MACLKPSERKKIGWYAEHRSHVKKTILKQADTVIFGDSISAGLSRYPSVCDLLTKERNIVNCSCAGDRIENVMWRLTHFSIPDSVRVGVLAVGTNNIDADKSLDIALGMLSCAAKMRELRPHLHVLISAILPRDLHVTSRRAKIRQVNDIK